MGAEGRRGLWQPRGSGLLVAVVALSVVALVAHGAIALVLLGGTVHRSPSTAQGSSRGPSVTASPTPAQSPAQSPPTSPSTSPPTSPSDPPRAATPHLDHACLAADNPPTTAAIPAGDPFGTDMSELGDKAELQRLYEVRDRDLVPIDGAGPVRACDRQLWGVVLTAMPTYLRTFLKEFLVFDSDASGKSGNSAIGDMVAADHDAGRWRMSLAPNGETDVDVAVTVAHEIGHLLTLNAGQLATPQPATCSTLDVGEGCLGDTSYLIEFFERTWTDAEVDEWNHAVDEPAGAPRDKALKRFYDKHHATFVDSYAATDPVEDFAETFGIWCAIDQDNPVRSTYVEGDPSDGGDKLRWMEKGSSTFHNAVFAGCQDLQAMTR